MTITNRTRAELVDVFRQLDDLLELGLSDETITRAICVASRQDLEWLAALVGQIKSKPAITEC